MLERMNIFEAFMKFLQVTLSSEKTKIDQAVWFFPLLVQSNIDRIQDGEFLKAFVERYETSVCDLKGIGFF